MKLATVTIAVFVFFTIAAALVSAQPSTGRYELTKLSYRINENRSVNIQMQFTLFNTTPNRVINSVPWTIPAPTVKSVNVWPLPAKLEKVENGGASVTIWIKFEGGLGIGKRLTYFVSCIADGLVPGSGPEYKGQFGSRGDGKLEHENYIVVVQGPEGTRLFLTKPQAQEVENELPTIMYETQLGADEDFGGIQARFYSQPAYYKLILIERLTNESTKHINNVQLDIMLFTEEAGWQFSALSASSLPIKTMYIDEENNWHGVFDVGEISPSATKELQLELIYEVDVYDPWISENDVGGLSEASWLAAYLEPDDNWESDHPLIVQAATLAVGGETNAYFVGQKIVEFVVDRLNYQIQTTRHGALWAYQTRVGDCSEYTDLSIALARAAGLPARAMYGWGYSEDNFIGHAWVEFYLPNKGWQPADPTWAETSGNYFVKLDPIHLTRNVRGLSSSESGLTFSYRGAAPEFKENVNLLVLTASGAAQEYISAAEYAIEVAEKLLADSSSENLSVKLQLAQQNLEQAQTAGDENQKILYAKQSIENANEIISSPSASPQRKRDFSSIGMHCCLS